MNLTSPGARRFLNAALFSSISTATSAAAQPLSFIAIGDTPYSSGEAAAFSGPISQAIRADAPPFVIHYGDLKSGKSDCSDALLRERRDAILNLLPGRVFYTPGDNEWTDCDRRGIVHPLSELNRLDLIRRLFYANAPQPPADWAYARQDNFPENARWMVGDTMFATIHLVGTNNGRQQILLDDPQLALAMVDARDQANRVWLDQTFEQAKKATRAQVVATQADVTESKSTRACDREQRSDCDAFFTFRRQIRQLAMNFYPRDSFRKLPVLLLHGDTSPYCWDKKFGGASAPNLWRLNAWGDYQTPADATKITIQTENQDQPFSARTLVGRQSPESNCSTR